jgi:Tfp pilus assembly protein PilN
VRPVNLIPPEERRGDKAPTRTGSLAYVVVGVLAAALLGVTAVVLTNNQVSDRKAEKASLEQQVATAQAKADRLGSFARFASTEQAREQTVASLAQSRFDWERVLRELAIVIPQDVWLTNLTASVSATAASSGSTSSTGGSGDAGSAENVEGPSLQIEGCAAGHEAVARFLAALQDVDGVTRVSVLNSDLPDPSGAAGETTATSGADSAGCSSRDFVSQFQVVAAFDEVQIDPTTQGIAPEPATTVSDQSQVADGQQELQQQRDSADQEAKKGRNAVDTFIPGTGTTP